MQQKGWESTFSQRQTPLAFLKYLLLTLSLVFLFVSTCISALCCAVCLVAHSCLTLCTLMDCRRPSLSVQGDSPGKNTGVGCHALLQGVFPTQESSPGHLHCLQILYHLSPQGSPRIVGSLSLLQGIFPSQ